MNVDARSTRLNNRYATRFPTALSSLRTLMVDDNTPCNELKEVALSNKAISCNVNLEISPLLNKSPSIPRNPSIVHLLLQRPTMIQQLHQ